MTRKEFIAMALLSNTDECILWPFAIRKSSGYGAYSERAAGRKVNYDIHRFICAFEHGEPEIGEEASHRCGNKLCVNSKHLRWATHLDNMQDAIQHGTLIGGGRYRQRISYYDRAVIQASRESYSVLADRYATRISYIGALKRMPLQHDL